MNGSYREAGLMVRMTAIKAKEVIAFGIERTPAYRRSEEALLLSHFDCDKEG